jgi:hypothetical protein
LEEKEKALSLEIQNQLEPLESKDKQFEQEILKSNRFNDEEVVINLIN